MENNLTKQLAQRPDFEGQIVPYTSEPKYKQHQAYEDKLAILVCQIKVWKPEDKNWFKIPKTTECLTIRECESVEVSDSAKDLINKAVIKFPRGTVISKSSLPEKKVAVGDKTTYTATTPTLKEATNDGDVLVPGSTQYSDTGISTTSIAVNYDDKGLIDFNRSKTEAALLSRNDIAIGNRIEVRLGYAYSEAEFKSINSSDNGTGSPLDVVFTGFVTAVSVSTPLEIECTNMAHVLVSTSAPNVEVGPGVTVKDFLDKDGKYKALEGTGIELAKDSQGCEIEVNGGTISENLTVADVLTEWGNSGILCIMDTQSDGSVKLRVGLTYNVGLTGSELPNNDKKYITYNGGANIVKLIQFDWDVAQDKLTLKHNDKRYLAIEAHGKYYDTVKGKKVLRLFKRIIIKNPDADDDGWIVGDEDKFRSVNKKEVKGQKQVKHKDGTTSNRRINGATTDRVDLSKYMIAPYFSSASTPEKLEEEAKQYWGKYNPNGISGSISIFGDLYIKPTEIVGLIDTRHPEKNGYYYVESVTTEFGVNGFRRELTIPYKISSFSRPVQIIK